MVWNILAKYGVPQSVKYISLKVSNLWTLWKPYVSSLILDTKSTYISAWFRSVYLYYHMDALAQITNSNIQRTLIIHTIWYIPFDAKLINNILITVCDYIMLYECKITMKIMFHFEILNSFEWSSRDKEET